MNMPYGVFLPQSAKYREKEMQICDLLISKAILVTVTAYKYYL